MQNTTKPLASEIRPTNLSHGELNRYREAGKVPAHLQGDSISPTNIFVRSIDLQKTLQNAGLVHDLNFGGKKILVNAKELQRDPLSGDIIHVNFQEIKRGQRAEVEVPLQMTGKAKGEKVGGVSVLVRDALTISAMPKNIPEHIAVDVSHLELGDTIHLSNLPLPKGVKLADMYLRDPEQDLAIATCVPPKVGPETSATESDTAETAPEETVATT